MSKSSVYSCIYAIVKRIPYGRVATYGQIARLAGVPRCARQVGYALHSLTEDEDIPWHRVINREGRISLHPAGSGTHQRSLLESEGILFNAEGTIPLKKYGWQE
jgi:methylated-DNA-protein-cysteine methyltransferase related protein